MLPVVAEDWVFEELARGRPVGRLQLQTAQCDVSQTWREVRRDAGCCGGTGDLRTEITVLDKYDGPKTFNISDTVLTIHFF